jgi:hypothetical protein
LPNPTPKDELRPGGRNNHSRTQNPTANTGQFIAETLPHRKKKNASRKVGKKIKVFFRSL